MTAPQLPDPLVPAEVDLRGYEFVPLFGDRLLGSETWISATSEAKVAAIRLWWRAYAKEVPASSLPDNDSLLSDYAGYGIALKAWRKVKPQAMRGFVLCSDGRWYHRFISELALDAWKGRKAHQLRTLKARIAALETRLSKAATDDDRAHINGLLRDLRQTLLQAVGESVTDTEASLLHGPTGRGTGKGQGQGQGQGEGQDKEKPKGDSGGKSPPAGEPTPGRAAAIAVLLRAWEKDRGKVTRIHSAEPRVQEWASAGLTDEQLREAYDLAIADRVHAQDDGPINAGFLHVFVQKLLNPKPAKGAPLQQREWHETHAGVKAEATRLGIEHDDTTDPRWLKCAIAVKVGGDHWAWIDPKSETQKRWIAELREDAERAA